MPTPEGDVLKPIDPSAASSDDWEIFILNNAQVVHEKNGKPVSLLAAYADTPLKVTGTFTPGRGQSKYLLSKSKKPIDLEIRNVTRFSYGELTDGEFAIWAEGNAGWFEIRPAPHYNSIYEDMIEAVQLLYFVTDIYGEPRKKGGGPSTQLIFQEYAEDERFACTDPAVAAEIFHKHHIFLMMCFLNRAQGIGWSSTPIYQSFRRQFPSPHQADMSKKDFETCKARVEGRYTQVLPERPTRTSKSTTPSAPQAAPAAAQAKPGRGKAAVEKTDEAPKKDNNWWEAAALFEFMQKAVNQRALRAGRNQITVERLAQLVVKRYQIEDVETAQKLKPRRDRATLKDEETQSSDTSSEEEDVITTPVRRPPGRRKKGRLSILRPTSSRLSGKSKSIKHKQDKAGKGKAPVPTSDESGAEEAEEDSDEATNSDDEMGVDTPTQALSPSREKRKLGETDADEQAEKTRRKRAASTPESPPTTVASEDEDADIPDGTAVPPLPLRHRPNSNNKSDVAPSLVSTPLPTYEPNGPRDSWICSFDGCSQRIYGCSKEIGRQLITEHLEDHAKGREKVVGILWREQDKLHLPVRYVM
ncbi:hypothetical protein SNOG_10250 [Parastagonospora nodorum SN15]|uniref:DNA (cytosine-5)-methyltransferase 1 replication foci domain-containing protein n=1 Tax=Phaeosphaeria nodorum (strain SN15 / ATCC MYA-4574 / FGSC 10173) TaxID=321614 RepID=Q0UDB4_PHANO|nr:hypothetical protein SNOG_10250 [Parastagonospora nodorum SN15]EAT82585.2 hypothetical protein SNOG_10250 [Parastagonospora nodorum SN15]